MDTPVANLETIIVRVISSTIHSRIRESRALRDAFEEHKRKTPTSTAPTL